MLYISDNVLALTKPKTTDVDISNGERTLASTNFFFVIYAWFILTRCGACQVFQWATETRNTDGAAPR